MKPIFKSVYIVWYIDLITYMLEKFESLTLKMIMRAPKSESASHPLKATEKLRESK